MQSYNDLLKSAIEETPGWLGGEGEATTKEAISVAELVLDKIKEFNLSISPDYDFFSVVLFPTPEGGLEIEFINNPSELTVHVLENGMIYWFAFDEIGHYFEDDLNPEEFLDGKFTEALFLVKEVIEKIKT
jgi:hypothetical protein